MKRVDWVGAFLFIGGMATFLIGLSWAGIQFAWASVQTLVPICVGISTLGLSIAWECYFAKEPFITVSLFSSVSALAAYAGAFCNGFIVSVWRNHAFPCRLLTIHPAFLRFILRPSLFHGSSVHDPDPVWYQPSACHMLLASGKHSSFYSIITIRPVQMGNLDWLGHHRMWLWLFRSARSADRS
jgi:TM2 domain-containing membrane protein YozV